MKDEIIREIAEKEARERGEFCAAIGSPYSKGHALRASAIYGQITALLRILDQAGLAVVPKEPTPEMLGAWYRYKNGFYWPGEPSPPDTSDVGAYRAMLATLQEGRT